MTIQDTLEFFFPEFFYNLADNHNTFDGYPPVNLIKINENEIELQMAVAGLKQEDLNIVLENNLLTISTNTKHKDDKAYIYRGIATRMFRRQFELPKWTVVKNATLENGLLSIKMSQEIPEERKPKQIPIASPSLLVE